MSKSNSNTGKPRSSSRPVSPLTATGGSGITKKSSVSRKIADSESKNWRVGRITKSGKIASFDLRELTRDEAESAAKGSSLVVIPFSDILALQKLPKESFMGQAAFIRLYTFRCNAVSAKWPMAHRVSTRPKLPKNREISIWVVVDEDGRVGIITENEQTAGHYLDSSREKFNPTAYRVTVAIPTTPATPKPPRKRGV